MLGFQEKLVSPGKPGLQVATRPITSVSLMDKVC